MSPVARPAVAILLPDDESGPVATELQAAGFDPIFVRHARELTETLAARRDVVLAVLDAETDPLDGSDAWMILHEGGRNIPALLVVDENALDTLDPSAAGHADHEYVIRPYSS